MPAIELASLPATNPHPVLICRGGGDLAYCNSAAEKLVQTLGLDSAAALLPVEHLRIKQRCLSSNLPTRAEVRIGGLLINWSYHPAGPNTVHLYGIDSSELHSTTEDRISAPTLNAVLDHLAFGVVLIDAKLTVHYANPAARDLLDDPLGLHIEAGVLRSAHAASVVKIKQIIHRLCRPSPGPKEQNVLTLSRAGAGSLEVIATPVHSTGFARQRSDRLVALFVLDPTAADEDTGAILCSLYGLTPAEGKIAALLVGGCKSGEIAAALAIRMPTLRTHLRSLFRKTHTTGQTELVRLLASGVTRFVPHL